ncbi:MAG TPA: hypothetical protein EYP33_06890 [Pyrodictium sp.]|nr:hypothetical protein [Pyrodictium sp.]
MTRSPGPVFGLREASPIGVIGAAGLAISAAGNILAGSAMGAALLGWLFTSLAGDALAHRLEEHRVLRIMFSSGLLWLAGMSILRIIAENPEPQAALAFAVLAIASGILRSYALGAAHQLVGKLARRVSVEWLSSTLSGSSAIVVYSISDSPALLAAAGVLLSIGPLAEELLWMRLGLLR